MEALQTLSRNDQIRTGTYGEPDDENGLSKDGLAVSEEEYWEKYYNDPDFVYEWNNGYLEVKPMSDQKGSESYQWFCNIMRCYIQTYPVGRISNLEIGFRLSTSKKIEIRRPDLAVVLNDNLVEINDDDCTYQGVFDLCVESLSHSSDSEIIRDTVDKKGEYEGTGVREYYILDARKTETVFYRLNRRGQYQKISPVGDIIRSGILPGFQFRISDLYRKPSLEELAEDPVYHDYVFPSFKAVKKELALEKQRAEREKQRAEKEKQRAEKEKRRAEREKQRAEKEKRRAEKEKRRAEKEKQRAEKAEKDLLSEKQRVKKQFLEAARNMLASGLDTAAVMSFTGLSAGEIATLKPEI
ncbi:Uma2 family endonuclease [Desulfobacterales bacterium HSG2]|nr:Uma2 family endonuclease [Desulfobacterales bacterium HSG2]